MDIFTKIKIQNKQGQSLLEVILAMAIFVLLAGTLVTLATGGFSALEQGGEQTEAEALADEAIEAVRGIRDQAWNKMLYGESAVTTTPSGWNFVGEASTDVIGQYTRIITFSQVCRDQNNSIVECPGSYTDIHTKKVDVLVSWEIRPGVTNEVVKTTYITNWDSKTWKQTDWSGGIGQNIWVDETKFFSASNINTSANGQITLAQLPGEIATTTWTFTTSTLYTYDLNKIEVVNDVAQLKTQTSNYCFGTPNACTSFGIQINCTNQLGCTWTPGQGGGCQNNGSCGALPAGQCSTCGGASCVRNKNLCTGTLNCSLFVNQTSCTAVCGQCLWITPSPAQCTGIPNACGTFISKKNCTDQLGCTWISGNAYPTDLPSIHPNDPFIPPVVESWNGFIEVANKNGGEIYYQLSDDSGLTWYYWDGLAWSPVVGNNYSTASVVNANIGSFSATNGSIMFQAFLESNGINQVQLDEIAISYMATPPSFAETGELLSSFFSMGDISAIQIVEWDENVSSCQSNCSVDVQIRAAEDNAGSPGVWTDWYGASGINTNFTEPLGAFVPLDLLSYYWVQYKVMLSGNGETTPVVSEIRVNYR